MGLKSDYGLYLVEQGYNRAVAQFFYSVPITHISIVNNRLFSTLINREEKGVEYAVSFDFDMDLIGNFVALAPQFMQGEIMLGLGKNEGRPYTIEISEPFTIGIEAHLGELQSVERERFIPFVVKGVFRSDDRQVAPPRSAGG